MPIAESATPIDDLVELPAGSDAKPAPRQKFRLDVPGTYVTVQFGFADESLRIYHQDPTTVFPRVSSTLSFAGHSLRLAGPLDGRYRCPSRHLRRSTPPHHGLYR